MMNDLKGITTKMEEMAKDNKGKPVSTIPPQTGPSKDHTTEVKVN